MKNKFFILFILIFVFSSSLVFGATVPEMTEEMAQIIINSIKNNLDVEFGSQGYSSSDDTTYISQATDILNNTTAEQFANFFNQNFITKLNANSDTSNFNIDFKNITAYTFRYNSSNQPYVSFMISNNTYPGGNSLGYQKIKAESVNMGWFRLLNQDGNVYQINMSIKSANSFSMSGVQKNYGYQFSIKENPYNPTFNEDDTIMYFKNQLALSDYQECYYMRSLSDNRSYIIGNRIQTEITPPSGDTPESGDTGGGTTNPSGDTPGTTPNYNEKLDNIQTGINNIENKIPTSGEVQEVISGTLNEAFGEGSGEVTSEQIDNLQNDVNEIMGDIVPANNFIGMFNQIISAFSEALLGQGEETIEFDHRGEHYVISSNQVNLPIAEIKGFLSVFFNVAIVMAMALTISWIIRRMEEGDLISVLHMGDADMYFYEDLNLF